MKTKESYLNTPVGLLKITVKDDKLISINYENEKININDLTLNDNEFILEIKNQLQDYFEGKRKDFNIQLDIKGTKFKKDVYKTLIKVKYGETTTYKELAKNSGHPKAYRAVGTALKNNKIPIIIPCHRVLKTDQGIGNYNGGKWRKEKLLQIEGVLT